MDDDDDTEAALLALTGRVRELEDRVPEGVVEALNDKIDQLLAEQAAAPKNFHWPDLEDEDRQKRWTAFLAWVQNVLCDRYPRAVEALRPCWWQHLDAVDAVTAAWFAWVGAYRSGQAAPTDPGNWQRTYLPAMLEQVNAALTSCEWGHEPDAPRMEALNTVPMTL